jgi:hypothetical protein
MLNDTTAKSIPESRNLLYGGDVAKMVPSPAFTARFTVSWQEEL